MVRNWNGNGNGLVNVGIVGCGYWGQKHLRVFSELSNSRVLAVCDADAEGVRRFSKAYQPQLVTSDYEKMLRSRVDAVVIATPPSTHYQLALQALMEGKHVLVEKPFATSTAEAEHLIQVAQEKELILMVGHTFLYNPAVNFLREVIISGRIGEPFYLHGSRLNFGIIQRDVNVIWDLAPHDLSIMLYLLDKDPISVAVQSAAHLNPDRCEVAHLDLRFSAETLGHIHVSWLHPYKVRQLTLIGSEGMAVYDDVSMDEPIRLYDRRAEPCDGGRDQQPSVTYRYGDIQIPRVSGGEPLGEEDAHFLDCIVSGKTPRTDGRAGLKVVSILETVEKMLANGSADSAEPPRMILDDRVSAETYRADLK